MEAAQQTQTDARIAALENRIAAEIMRAALERIVREDADGDGYFATIAQRALTEAKR
jgi:hypothetical protein